MGLLDAIGLINKTIVRGFQDPKRAYTSPKTKSPILPAAPAAPAPPVALPKVADPTYSTIAKMPAAGMRRPSVDLDHLAVYHPPPPLSYRGLQVGPELSIEYEPNVASQVESSVGMLRQLSPFMIRLEPPAVYGEMGGFQNQQANTINVNAFGAAGRTYTNFETARTAILRSGLGSMDVNAGSVQEFMAVNARDGSGAPQGHQETPINGGPRLGEPAVADLNAAVDIAWQLSAVAQMPPLVLLINPASLQIQYTKVQQFQDRTRFGYVFHAWGEELPKLSITAKCGAFMSGGRGLSFASRRDSAAWQNLMNLFHIYRSNGYIYDTVGKSNAHHFVGALSIHYDGWVYYGHIESFTFAQEDANQHGGIEFNIEFTASAMADTNQPSFAVMPLRSPIPSLSDPRYQGLENKGRNQPGEFSVGLNSDGTPRLTTQGRAVSPGDALFTMVPQDAIFSPSMQVPGATTIGRRGGLATDPVGQQGFQSPISSTSGSRVVTLSDMNRVNPFRVGL